MGKKIKRQNNSSISSPSVPSPSPPLSISSSPKFIFFSGIFIGVVVAVAVVVAFFLPSSSLSSISSPSFSPSISHSNPSIELQKSFEKLLHIKQQGKSISDPLKSADFLVTSLESFERIEKSEVFETLEFATLLDEIADAQHRAKRFENSEKLHRRALEVKMRNRERASANDFIYSFVALATDLFSEGKTTEALEQTQRAHALVSQLPNKGRARIAAMLARLDSAIFECEADFVSALHRFEHSLSLQPTTQEDKKKHMERLHTHRDLLRKVLAYHSVPENIAKKMKERESEVEKELMGMGDWITNMQLPKVFLSNLTSKPWHDINDYPQLREAYDVVLKSFPSIREEYFELNSKSILTQQGECIHDKNRGKWAVHDITSYWVPKDNGNLITGDNNGEKETEGCSIYAPDACKLFRQLKNMGFPVIRAGYSAIAPTAWIRPHFGMTNGQLKFHLGLVVPKKEGVDCAFMRVGNEIRPWHEGQISFFDDSYLSILTN